LEAREKQILIVFTQGVPG